MVNGGITIPSKELQNPPPISLPGPWPKQPNGEASRIVSNVVVVLWDCALGLLQASSAAATSSAPDIAQQASLIVLHSGSNTREANRRRTMGWHWILFGPANGRTMWPGRDEHIQNKLLHPCRPENRLVQDVANKHPLTV